MSVLPPAEIDCPECNGDGWYQETESGHGCDGTPQSCAVRCPVPIPVQVECGACRGTGSVENIGCRSAFSTERGWWRTPSRPRLDKHPLQTKLLWEAK